MSDRFAYWAAVALGVASALLIPLSAYFHIWWALALNIGSLAMNVWSALTMRAVLRGRR